MGYRCPECHGEKTLNQGFGCSTDHSLAIKCYNCDKFVSTGVFSFKHFPWFFQLKSFNWRVMTKKVGIDAINEVYATIGRTLNDTSSGRKLLMDNPHVQQELSVRICKNLGLICGRIDDDYRGGDNWHFMCNKAPHVDGLCRKHYELKTRQPFNECAEEMRKRKED